MRVLAGIPGQARSALVKDEIAGSIYRSAASRSTADRSLTGIIERRACTHVRFPAEQCGIPRPELNASTRIAGASRWERRREEKRKKEGGELNERGLIRDTKGSGGGWVPCFRKWKQGVPFRKKGPDKYARRRADSLESRY